MPLLDPPTRADPELLDPEIYPPPRATKLIIYTACGTIITGPWADDGFCLLWMHCPKVGQQWRDELRARAHERGSLYC